MTPTIPKTNTDSNTSYVKVNVVDINDKSGKISKEWKFPSGTIFQTTNNAYEITESGIIKYDLIFKEEGEPSFVNPQKLNNNSIGVTLPQYTALNFLDVNNDNCIDKNDNKYKYSALGNSDGYNSDGDAVKDSINVRLRSQNSDYYVGDLTRTSSGVYVSEDGYFNVSFLHTDSNLSNDSWEQLMKHSKNLTIKLPEAQSRIAQEETKIKDDIKDDKYAKEHPILNWIGFDRETYEKFFK